LKAVHILIGQAHPRLEFSFLKCCHLLRRKKEHELLRLIFRRVWNFGRGEKCVAALHGEIHPTALNSSVKPYFIYARMQFAVRIFYVALFYS
jgi:hypothetical protein